MDDTAVARALALVNSVLAGDHRATARLLTLVENRWPGWMEAMAQLHPHCGNARVVGITGGAGVGKSTLTAALAESLLEKGHAVAVVAVDPSSPLSGGAVLGDRVRMGRLAERRTFIRSLATRGSMGGLSRAARDTVRVLDAAGYAWILVETVGVGQDEVDVARLTGTVVVVCTPGQGDGVQAIKAGLMEIADVLVLNKADAPGADKLASELHVMLHTRADARRRDIPVMRTVAIRDEGIEALVDMLSTKTRAAPVSHAAMTSYADDIVALLKPLIETELSRTKDEEGGNPYVSVLNLIRRLGITG